MKNNVLLVLLFGSLSLWPVLLQAAPPRYENWGDWQNRDMARTSAQTAPSMVVADSGDSSVKPSSEAPAQATAKPAAQVQKPRDESPAAEPARPGSRSATAGSEEGTALGPPTKGRRMPTASQDDRQTPPPSAKVIVTQERQTEPPPPVMDEKLSWWERMRRQRQGIPLKPVIVPDSHVYTVRLQDGRWDVAATRLECRLTQRVPRLGDVMFRQKVATELEFVLQLNRRYEEIHQASFESQPTLWGHQSHQRDMPLTASMQQSSMTVPQEGAVALINELLAGMAPRLTYRMGSDERSDEVVVTLSARTFVDKLEEFQRCIGNLLPFDFEEVKASIVYFNFDSDTLTDEAQQALERVVEYVRQDQGVKSIVIEGHTDSKGKRRYNQRLAGQRAAAVEKFFLDRGVTKSRLVLRAEAYGAKKPAASNKSAEGRAQNRRVHVSLFK
ncbi:MAG: OmpA family protein [Gammaproteobacteria bacterium]